MTKKRTSSDLELLLDLDREADDPLHRQLEQALRVAVRDGRLAAGSTLPSTRALAAQLAVSRGIVVEAYEQLVAEGYLRSRPGGATHVARMPALAPRTRTDLLPPVFEFDFRSGRPDVNEFPRAAWLRSLRRVLTEAPSDRLTYLGGHGVPELRLALAAYLNRARGTAADPADVVICSGFAQGLGLIVRTLRRRGARRIAVEDPSDPVYWGTIRDAGLETVGIPVDAAGLQVDRLDGADVDAVVVTGAHQYPTGAVLSPERRAALIDWADRRGGYVIEDDYDAEFRYDREPIGAIHGLCTDRVVYAGSLSKVLAPGLRLGWLVAPAELVDDLTAAKEAADMGSSAIDQLGFADMLVRGELDHHLRRMRPIYRRRRDALLEAIARHLPELRPTGAAAGLHVLAWLPLDLDETAIQERAVAAGIIMGTGVTPRRMAPGPAGLIFGYGTITEDRIEPGIERLAGVIAGMRSEAGPGSRARSADPAARSGAQAASR